MRTRLTELNLEEYSDINCYIPQKDLISIVNTGNMNSFIQQWHNALNKDSAIHGQGGNKLRTYRLFKSTFETEQYVKSTLPRSHRSALSKFRIGVAPIRLETGRYEGLPVHKRHCFNCTETVESESHVLLHCDFYNDFRSVMFDGAKKYIDNFNLLSDSDKLSAILSHPLLVKISAKFCSSVLTRRRFYLK